MNYKLTKDVNADNLFLLSVEVFSKQKKQYRLIADIAHCTVDAVDSSGSVHHERKLKIPPSLCEDLYVRGQS